MLCAKDGLDLFNRLVIIIFSLESKSRAVARCGCAPGENKILHPKKPRKKEDSRKPVNDIPGVHKIHEDLVPAHAAAREKKLQDLTLEHTDVCAQRHTSALQLAY